MSRAQLHVVLAARQLSRRLGCAAALVVGGCYTYRPLEAPVPAAGTRVQVALTDAGADSLAARVGPNIELVDGDVVRADSTSMTLAVREVENSRGERDDWNGEQVTVPRGFVRDLQQRRMSVGGTGLLGGAIAASLVAATAAFGGSGGAEGGGNGTRGPAGE
jgi:hypothetical protein